MYFREMLVFPCFDFPHRPPMPHPIFSHIPHRHFSHLDEEGFKHFSAFEEDVYGKRNVPTGTPYLLHTNHLTQPRPCQPLFHTTALPTIPLTYPPSYTPPLSPNLSSISTSLTYHPSHIPLTGFRTEGGYNLGLWLENQRQARKKVRHTIKQPKTRTHRVCSSFDTPYATTRSSRMPRPILPISRTLFLIHRRAH